jgi:hypothetical protein
MYGRVSALEITISESELVEAFRATGGLPQGEYDEADLSELGDVTDTVVEDSFAYSFDEKGGFKANFDVRSGIDLDIEDVERAYRSYLASLESGEVTVPMLCDMQKYREHVKDDGYQAMYRFAYVSSNATLEFVGMQNFLRTELEQRDSELVQSQGFLEVANNALQLLRDENELLRNEAAEKERVITDAGESINRAAAEITELRNQIADLGEINDERDTLRRRVFQLEGGGEQIDRWIRSDADPSDVIGSIRDLLASVGGPWTPDDDS